MGKDPVDEDFVTAPVTEAPRPQTPWEAVGLTEEEWKDLEIPKFLRRTDTTEKVSPAPSARAPATAAAASAGNTSGETTSAPTKTPPVTAMPGATGNFEQFRVDPEEIESKIKAEADRRWRNWKPNRKDLDKRPRLSTFLKQVRKEFYP